jgi:hypothetical protein
MNSTQAAAALIITAAMISAHPALGQGSNACAVRARSSAVAVVICPPNLGQERWKQAGEAACAEMATCSAWIWDDPSKAPQSAPPLATGLTQQEILSSAAIWDNDTKRLVLIERVRP